MDPTSWKTELLCILKNPRVIFAQDIAWHSARKVSGHKHDCYQLDFFYRGTGKVTIRGQEYCVRPGDLFITNPSTEHDFIAASERPMEGVSVKFDLRLDDRVLGFPAYVANLGMMSRNQQREMEHYLRGACEEANHRLPESQELAAALLSVFFLLLLRYLADVENLTSQDGKAGPCERVLDYVKQHYSRRITLADLARIAGLEPRYLCRRFSKEIGIPPMAALGEERMRAAKQLLANTTIPVGEIGLRVGYQDTYHFSKRFKEMVGMSPKHYRSIAAAKVVGPALSPQEELDGDTSLSAAGE